MGKPSDTTHQIQPSALEKIRLSFEYDVTWQDARKAVRRRTDSKK